MRYRLMATYHDSPFEAGIGPGEDDIVLFAACPPPEDLGFEPATGHWRKQLRFTDVQAVWESRPVGAFRGERCIVLDDLGDRLHIGYLGHDGYRAEQLGYWQVDRGVFELVAPRTEVSDIVEERIEYSRPGDRSSRREPDRYQAPSDSWTGGPPLAAGQQPLPLEAEALRAASASRRPVAPAARPDVQPRAARPRLATERLFADLAGLAGIPAASYSVGEEVDGALCLIQTASGFSVFHAAAGARHEVQVFATEEAACFYLFGVLAAEAVRTGALARVPTDRLA